MVQGTASCCSKMNCQSRRLLKHAQWTRTSCIGVCQALPWRTNRCVNLNLNYIGLHFYNAIDRGASQIMYTVSQKNCTIFVSSMISVTFSFSVTSFIHKVCLQCRQLGLQECLFYKVVQCMVAHFIQRLGADICCLKCRKKILKSDSNCQSYSKCYRGTLFWLAVSRARCAECIYEVVQQHNLGDVANSITCLCTETS